MTKSPIQMVDLKGQYHRMKDEIDEAILSCVESTRFIKGPVVEAFEDSLGKYLGVEHVISCANGTDALQIALMALGLERGDEVIVPSFTYVATAEVVALLGLTPVMVDVDPQSFNIDVVKAREAITPKTKAIVPVHLFGQNADMEPLMALAEKHDLFVIEDNAQAIGSSFKWSSGKVQSSGSVGHIGSTSFFPSKNLGCYGDGGALYTNDAELGSKIRMIANHGQAKKYYHSVVGVNSRLDAIQAAILNVKLRYLDDYCQRRQRVAEKYDTAFASLEGVIPPVRRSFSSHVFHQYTLKVENGKRDALKKHLSDNQIPSMIYYPLPLYEQEAFKEYYDGPPQEVTENLCRSVLSLPIHTEMNDETTERIVDSVRSFYH